MPQLLLPTKNVINFAQSLMPTDTSTEEEFGSLYVVRLLTSKANASSLSEFNGGILIALIGQNGEAIMERILAIEHSKTVEEDSHNHLRFQRGSVDTVKFYGPDVGQLSALWIAPESGTWRLDEAIITVLPCAEQSRNSELPSKDFNSLSLSRICESNVDSRNFEEHMIQTEKGSFRYIFKGEENLLGDKTDYPAAELIPSSISEILVGEVSSENALEICQKDLPTLEDTLKQRQIGLQEYMDLKVALITCTVSLVALGTACIAATGAEELAKGFTLGGTGSIIYLFLLQKVVDGLPSAVSSGKASETTVIKSAESWTKSILATPLARLALVTSTVIVLGNLLHGDFMLYFQPQVILAGVAGFFTSKVAIFLVGLRSVHGNSKNVTAANKDNNGK
ncbi:hypothetical protein O6H91_16G092900 [Diphasiastrum complanatum]|uniref:Uncharacterized protein n=1 Tax=Diphasiastrum complanatum TaxID=34168 RepID=A0ACC2BER9_DIPCM|nr:hypothetical protein O6H91_16G092900 [Diphasiastrum complanatum]